MKRLLNYLRASRKRLSLSQQEAAFLAGLYRGSSISRYEESDREPDLEKVIAFEIIFKRSVKELFPDLYRKVEERVLTRVRILLYKTDRERPGPDTVRKRQALLSIVNPASNNLNQA
jgi:transcriptional regulator with XRE-family HTH domain